MPTITVPPIPGHIRATPRAAFFAELFVIGLLTYLVHEAAHWLAGAAMGLPMAFHLNGVVLQAPATSTQKAIIDIAGPAVTVLQAFIAYRLLKRRDSLRAFGFVYMAGFMRIVAGFISFIYLNDEARFSRFLDLPAFVVPLLVGGILFALMVAASRHLRLGWKTQLVCYLAASMTLAIIVGGDMLMRQ